MHQMNIFRSASPSRVALRMASQQSPVRRLQHLQRRSPTTRKRLLSDTLQAAARPHLPEPHCC
jgi:hypothetical protein